MITVTYYEELAVASLRLLLILIGVLICVEIIIKSAGRLRNSMIFFVVSFIPSALYTLGKIINMDSVSENGEFLSLLLNFLTTLFILCGLWNLLLLVRELAGEIPEKKEKRKSEPSEKMRTPRDYSAIRKKKKERRITILR